VAKYIIVKEGQVVHRYEASGPQTFGYLWMPPIAEHREVPDGVCLECAAVVNNQVIEDTTLHAAKVQRQWDSLRFIRNARLAACDWTQMPDSPLSAAMKANWATYRQSLRDLPENTVDPSAPVWPSEPEA
jgi:hypothetical protein